MTERFFNVHKSTYISFLQRLPTCFQYASWTSTRCNYLKFNALPHVIELWIALLYRNTIKNKMGVLNSILHNIYT